jgi:hypothetical protein
VSVASGGVVLLLRSKAEQSGTSTAKLAVDVSSSCRRRDGVAIRGNW